MYQSVPGGGSIFYNPIEKHDYSKDYFTLVALEDGQFKFTANGCGAAPMASHYYSIDDGKTWTELPANTYTPTITTGNKVLWKNNMSTGYMAGTVSSTGMFDAQGNVMSLVYGDNFANQTSLEGYTALFESLFLGSKVQSASNLILPATALAEGCYVAMFNGCTSLTTAPELPATTLAQACYNNMFNNCWRLTTAPVLSATTLANLCYQNMFAGCRSLTTAPELPATTLADYCYTTMFAGCTSLTTAPELPAETLADWCYASMFASCTSLTTAPELPATTLTDSCYSSMFTGCTSLTTAPELPAMTLAVYCYQYMFDGCTSLTTAPELPVTTLAVYCYYGMFRGCSNLNSITCLATDISATDCTTTWVYGVAAKGTFTKAASMTGWGTGANGIPSGWTTVDNQ